jgi:hypothetical protein
MCSHPLPTRTCQKNQVGVTVSPARPAFHCAVFTALRWHLLRGGDATGAERMNEQVAAARQVVVQLHHPAAESLKGGQALALPLGSGATALASAGEAPQMSEGITK